MTLKTSLGTSVISIYTREQAERDGILIDISGRPEVKEAGFRVPVAITSTLWSIVQVPEKLKESQDLSGRLWDLLWMSKPAVKEMIRKEDWLGVFKVIFLNELNESREHTIWIVFNPAEGFTFMLPEDY